MAEQDKKHKLLMAMIYFIYLSFTINSVLHIKKLEILPDKSSPNYTTSKPTRTARDQSNYKVSNESNQNLESKQEVSHK